MLDARLQAVADFVPHDCSVADIGTDHAYLAIELYRANENRKVIAADLNAGPCEAARRTIREAGFEDNIEVRQGDGLSPLTPSEVETVCIAGMGGKLEADILEASPNVFAKLKCVVLQPQNGQEYLRQWLYEHDWHIEDEQLVKAEGRLYQIIKAAPGTAPMPLEAELILGPVLLKKQPELFREYVQSNIDVLSKIAVELQRGGANTLDKLQEYQRRIKLLEEYLS